MKYSLYSFDIFDTLITRTTATPYGIFSIIQKELSKKNYDIPIFIKRNFLHIRTSSEVYLRRMKGENINIYDIYEHISSNNFLSETEKNLLINLEIDTEIKHSVPIFKNINIVKKLYQENKKVILISDMYLPSDIIKKMLIKHDNIFYHIPIYISNEYNRNKRSKKLFIFIKEILNISYSQWIHTGDNLHSDIIPSKELLIDTIYFHDTALYNFEKEILTQYNYNINIENFIGYIKNIRMKYSSSQNLPMNIGISLGGPILFFYVNWIIENCIKENITNIFFISRDGFILQKIADIIIEYKNIKNINTHYLYSSRYAWQFPGIYIGMPIPEFIFDEMIFLKDIEFFFKIKIEDFLKLLPNQYKDLTLKLTNDDRKIIKNILINDESFKLKVLEHSKHSYELLKEYLIQEIDFNEKFCLVDTRGNGTTMHYVSEILKNELKSKLEVFYINSWSMDNNDFINKRCFFNGSFIFSDKIELLSRAIHGEVIGYKKNNDKVTPIFLNDDIKHLLNIDYNSYIEGVCLFAKKFLKKHSQINLLDIFIIYHKYLDNSVDSNIKNYLSSIPNKKTITPIVNATKKLDLEQLLLDINWFSLISILGIHLFAISNNRNYIRITLFGIKLTIKVNKNTINKIAWWIPIKKLRNSFRNKFN